VASPLPSASRMFIIRAGEEGAASRGPPPRGQRPAPSLSVRGEKGVRRPWRCQLPRVWLPGLSGSGAASGAASYRRRSVAARPPHGCRSRHARVGHVQVLPASPGAPGIRTTRRTLRGRRSCSRTVSPSLLWRGWE
jgi:hypothetical protein